MALLDVTLKLEKLKSRKYIFKIHQRYRCLIRRGVTIALRLPGKEIKEECAKLLEALKQWPEAAELFEKAECWDSAAISYIKMKNW